MIHIHPIPAFTDNYIWIVRSSDHKGCFVVDPGESDGVESYLEQHGLTLYGLLITHHHQDHTGGIYGLIHTRDIPVYGPANKRIRTITHPLHEGDSFTLFDCTVSVHETPGHTLDHISYLVQNNPHKPLLFCGDTLFSAGCGRLFEGSASQMQSTMKKLKALPPETAIYCAHEYTLANLHFARTVEPQNSDIENYFKQVTHLRSNDSVTLPSTMERELKVNPFLRISEPTIKLAAERFCGQPLTTEAEVLETIRHWKDNF